MLRNSQEEISALRDLRHETQARLGETAGMMISEDQGVFLRVLVGALAPKLAVEIGTFTGYSSACIALALPMDGKLICCDLNQEWTEIATAAWRRCGVEDRIDLRLGPALGSLEALSADTIIDMAFIDADKDNYIAYYEQLLARLRPNGLIVADNVMWHNWGMDSSNQDPETIGIREFNAHVAADCRVESVMIHVGDGLTLARKL